MTPAPCPRCATSTRVDGITVPGRDGVLYWICRKCEWAFPRSFPDPRLRDVSAMYVDEFNHRPIGGRTS